MFSIPEIIQHVISLVKLDTANITISLWGTVSLGGYFKNRIGLSILILASMKATGVAEE
jgi:hypothetical protein